MSRGPDYKEGREAARWVYELDGDKRADYFFVTCGQGIASVGSTRPERYPGRFRRASNGGGSGEGDASRPGRAYRSADGRGEEGHGDDDQGQ